MAPKKPQPTAGQATMLSFFRQKPAGKTGEAEVKKENKRPPQEEAPEAATKTKRPKSDFFSDEDEDFQQPETKSRFFQGSTKKEKEAPKAVPKSAEEMFGKGAVKRSNALPASAVQKAEKKTETKTEAPQPETPSKRMTRSATNTPSKEASGSKTEERGSKRSTQEEREEVRTPGRKRAKVEEEKAPTPKKQTPKVKTPVKAERKEEKAVTAKKEKKEKPVVVFEKKEKPASEKKEKPAVEKKEKPAVEKKEKPVVEKKEKAVAVKEEKEEAVEASAEKEAPAKKKFWEMKNREGPRALGSRDIPTGNANSLQGMTFVVTGELECITRDDWMDLIKRLGGRVTLAISKKTDYVVVGRDPGQSKLTKAGQCGTKQLTEEEFFTLVETLPAKGDYVPPPDKAKKEKAEKPKLVAPTEEGSSKRSMPAWVSKEEADTTPVLAPPKQKPTEPKPAATPTPAPPPPSSKVAVEPSHLWVDKHKPKSVKDIIGNKTNVDKLTDWLKGWQANHNAGAPKAKGAAKGAWGKGKQDASAFKAVLISGPPGIGKTTAAGLVASDCGYDVIEFNASDTRSKNSLRDEVADLLDNRAITEFYAKSSGAKSKRQQLLIMDEVDGMSAGDRGGMQELIQLIKTTKVPIICLCNDHSSRKVRSLINHCLDLRFARPNINQIKGKMMGICFKEGISIEPNALEQLITSTNNDIRQIINQLSVWRLSGEKLTYDGVKEKLQNARKDTVGSLGVFDAIRLVYTKSDSDRMTLDERLRMYYIDDMVALMSQENYLQFVPSMSMDQPSPRRQEAKAMDLISAAADSFCDGDIIDGVKRRQNAWGLMPNHGIASLVRPAYFMKGHMKGWQMNFPAWLGNYSKTSRCDRLLRELQVHVRTHASCSASEINQWYLPLLKTRLVQPLVARGAEGVDDVMGTLEAYTLTREDWDTVQELATYKGVTVEPKIDSKAKAAFTRTYNANPHVLPYAEKAALPKRAAASAPSEGYAEDEETGQMKEADVDGDEEEEEGEEEEGVGKDKMIKAAKVGTKGAAAKKAAGGAAAKKAPAKPRKK